MPGKESLRKQQYYTFPRNSFWYIMEQYCGASVNLDYDARINKLLDAGIALWDVLQHCEREGSLDSKIVSETEVPNDFEGLLIEYPNINHIFFNGKKAEKVFRKRVIPKLSDRNLERISLKTLPSTSPANTSMSRDEKVGQWIGALKKCLPRTIISITS